MTTLIDAPARLPRDEDELAEWSVYADALMDAGDPRGEWIAHDLAMSASPTAEQKRALRAVMPPALPGTDVVWSLGHAAHVATREAAFEDVIALLAEPRGRRVESLEITGLTQEDPDVWLRLFAALPPTCTRLALRVERPREHEAIELLPMIPPCVTTLALPQRVPQMSVQQIAHFLDDRFADVEIPRLPPDALDLLELQVFERERVRARVGVFAERVRHPRLVFGCEGEGAIALVPTREAFAFVSKRPHELDRDQGPHGIRQWLAHAYREEWRIPGDTHVERFGHEWKHDALPEGGTLLPGDIDRQTRELFA